MTPPDSVIKYGKSILQHGHLNNRVYIIKLAQEDLPKIIEFAEDLAKNEDYTKIFGKVPASSVGVFILADYVVEASIPSFFQGKEEAVFVAKYLDPNRKVAGNSEELSKIRSAAEEHRERKKEGKVSEGALRPAAPKDAEGLADLFRKVFPTYPFPVFDPDYIRNTMLEGTRYFLITDGEKPAAVASCEVDLESLTSEMTDFAVDPHIRGRGFARILLNEMEEAMRKEGIITVYTIARSISLPMNAVFAGAGYRFCGMLPNNTNISGSIESMNVWYKKL